MRSKLTAVLASLAVMIGLAVAVEQPANAFGTTKTLQGAITYLHGKYLQYGIGRETIGAFTCHNGTGPSEYCTAPLSTSCTGTATQCAAGTRAAATFPDGPPMPGKSVAPDAPTIPAPFLAAGSSWWNPFSWCWSCILQDMFSIVMNCLEGAAAGTIPTLTGTFIVNTYIRAAMSSSAKMIKIGGPSTIAAMAIAGCTAKLLFG